MAISLIDNTTGAGEPLNTGFDKVNQAIVRVNQFDALSTGDIAHLNSLAGVSPDDGVFLVGNGTSWVGESGSQLVDSIGLGDLAFLDNDGTADLELNTLEFPSVGNVDVDFLRVGENNGFGFFWRYTGSEGDINNSLELFYEDDTTPYSEGGKVLRVQRDGRAEFSNAVEVGSLDIGSTGHGFDSSGNVSVLTADVQDGMNLYGFSSIFFHPDVSGGWSRGVRYLDSEDNQLAQVGALGSQDTLQYIFVGVSFSDIYQRWNSELSEIFTNVRMRENLRFDGSLTQATTTVIDSSRNFFGADGDFSGNVDVLGTTTTDILDVATTSTFGGLMTLESGGLETDNFVDFFTAGGVQGFGLDYTDGSGSFEALYTNELIAKAFTVDVAQALAGSDILTKSVGVLAENFTVPYIDDVDDVNLGSNYFQVAGNVRAEYEAGDYVVVNGSTANDGIYTIVSVGTGTALGPTFITVSETIPDSTADGVIGASTVITVEDLQGLDGFRVFEDGDHVRFRYINKGEDGGAILDIYGQVTDYSPLADGLQSWTFCPYYSGASGGAIGFTINKGSVGLDYGVSGDYYMERTVLDRSADSGGVPDYSKVPYDRLVQWTGDNPRDGTTTVLLQSGNLNGQYGVGTENYGFAAGNYASGNYVLISENNVILKPTEFLVDVDNLKIDSANELITIGGSVTDILIGTTNAGNAPNYDGKFGINFGAYGTNPDNYWKYVEGFDTNDDYIEFEAGDGTEFIKLVTEHDSTGTLLDVNTNSTRLTNQDVTYKDAVPVATEYNSVNINIDGTGAQELESLSVAGGKCVRFWFDYSIGYSGAGSYELEIDIQGWNGSSWVTLDETEFTENRYLPLGYLYDGAIDANSSTQNVNGLTYTLTSNSSQPLFSGTWYLYMYALDAYSQYRCRVNLVLGSGGGGSKNITANQIRSYDRTAVFSKNGGFFRDADIIKGKATALGVQTEIDISALSKGTT